MQASSIYPGEAAAQSSTAPSPKLLRAAHEFEGQMMKELLKPMTGTDPLFGDDAEAEGDGSLNAGAGSGGALGEFAAEALGRALSERGGFGIANQIVRELSRSGNPPLTGKVTTEPHRNTAMRRIKGL
jgi:Rod binding domain-containing protein